MNRGHCRKIVEVVCNQQSRSAPCAGPDDMHMWQKWNMHTILPIFIKMLKIWVTELKWWVKLHKLAINQTIKNC